MESKTYANGRQRKPPGVVRIWIAHLTPGNWDRTSWGSVDVPAERARDEFRVRAEHYTKETFMRIERRRDAEPTVATVRACWKHFRTLPKPLFSAPLPEEPPAKTVSGDTF